MRRYPLLAAAGEIPLVQARAHICHIGNGYGPGITSALTVLCEVEDAYMPKNPELRRDGGAGAAAPILFYSKTGCPWANAVRRLLDAHGVPYEERNVRADPRLLAELRCETRQDFVPTLNIGGVWLVDTDAREVARRLGLPEPVHVRTAW